MRYWEKRKKRFRKKRVRKKGLLKRKGERKMMMKRKNKNDEFSDITREEKHFCLLKKKAPKVAVGG